MSIDLDDMARRIADGIYGDDRMTKEGQNDAFSALNEIIAAVERLRHDVADLQIQREGNIIDNMHAYEEGVAEGERRATVYLRERANAEHPIERGVPSLSPAGRGLLLLHADRIERGEHLKKEEEP